MDRTLLSICLPTYNQPQDFERTLKSIISQINSENVKKIEIIVGDNSDNEETKKLIESKFNLPYLSYYHHGKNLGIDRNLLFLLEKAKGEYVWFIGDDEVKQGSLDYILNILQKNPDLSLVWVNYETRDPYTGNISPPFRFLEKSLLIEDGSKVIEDLSIGLNFISANILNKQEVLKANRENLNLFIGTGLINFYLSLFVLSQKGKKFLLLKKVIIRAWSTPPEKLRWDFFNTMGIFFSKLLINFKKSFSRKSIRKFQKEIMQIVWRNIVVGWIRGYNSPRGKFLPFLKTYWDLPQAWFMALFLLAPKCVIEFLYYVYKKILKCPTYSLENKKIDEKELNIENNQNRNLY